MTSRRLIAAAASRCFMSSSFLLSSGFSDTLSPPACHRILRKSASAFTQASLHARLVFGSSAECYQQLATSGKGPGADRKRYA
jgi:hypothetical protein